MVAHEHDLLASQYQRNHAFYEVEPSVFSPTLRHTTTRPRTRFSRLRRLIDQHRPKLELGQPRIPRAHTRTTNHIRHAQNLLLAQPTQRLILALVVRAQLPLLVLELNQLLQLNVRRAVRHLLVQRQKRDRRVQRLPRLGRQPHHLEPRRVDLLRQLVHRDVRRRADQHLSRVHLREVVHDRGRRYGLARTRRPLDEAQRLLQHALHGVHLGVVELRQTRRGEPFRHLGPEDLGLEFVSEEFVVL